MAIPSSLEPYIARVGGQQRAILIVVGVAVAALIFGLSRWATSPQWVPAFADQPMETVAQITDKLEQAGIAFQLERGGRDVMVQVTDVARARVTLAKDGLPMSGRPGLELFDQPSWGMTDFTQRVNYRRALEGELERTIGKMRGVQAAQVHLALHEQSNFRQQETPANASVVLKTDGHTPSPEVVHGIAHLVASSVDGLTNERVTVLDDSGRLLSRPTGDGSIASLSTTQIAMQRDVEEYLQNKAEGLITDIVGPGNARIRVTATLNFDKIERQSQTVDPEKQATSTEQRYEITPGAEGGAASSNVAVSYENSTVTERFSGAIGNIQRLSVAVLVNDKQQEVAQIEALVKSAVGMDEARGDVVTVVSTNFDGGSLLANETEQIQPTVWDRVDQLQRPGIALLGFATCLIALLLVLRTIKGNAAPQGPLALTASSADMIAGTLPSTELMSATDAIGALAGDSENTENASNFNFLDRKNVRGKVVTTISHKPDVSVRAMRAWMKEA